MKSFRIFLCFALLTGIASLFFVMGYFVLNDPILAKDEPTSRVTVILADGERLREITGDNIDVSSGVVTVNPVFTTATTFTVGQGQSSGTTDLVLGDTALRYNHTSSRVEYYEDGYWLEVGSGSGTDWALVSADNTNIFATYTKTGQFTALDLADFQASAFVYLEDLATAETFFQRTEEGYSCTMQRWGKDASNQLVWEVGTVYDVACTSVVYTSTWTFSSTTMNRWLELAIQVDDTNNTVSFYVDGVMVDTQAYSDSLTTQATANETVDIYAGMQGKGGPFKIGSVLTWPITASAWKGIDAEGRSFPGLVWFAPFAEGRGSTLEDILSNDTYTIDGDVTWAQVEGRY